MLLYCILYGISKEQPCFFTSECITIRPNENNEHWL